MARFFADENFPQPVIEELRSLGHDVLTASEDGHASADDPIILARAHSNFTALAARIDAKLVGVSPGRWHLRVNLPP